MDHQDALRDMSVERYLLGELKGEPREIFEEHLFECPQCAENVKSGVTFLQGARVELSKPRVDKQVQNALGRRLQIFSPAWLVPALAACLLAVGYQSAVVIPAMRQQLAQADSPAILNDVVLTGASRGAGQPRITAPAHGSFLLSVDIPTQAIYASYLCSLYSPSGALVWQGSVSPQQAKDTVQIRVPADTTLPGENTLLVQGERQNNSSGAKLDDLTRHSFLLELSK